MQKYDTLKDEKERPTLNKTQEGKLDWSHLERNRLLKHVNDGKIEGIVEVRGRRRRRREQLLDDLKLLGLETERGSTRSSCLKNSLWKNQGPFPRPTTE
jgi:hypothetical protein